MKNKHLILSLLFLLGSNSAWAQDNLAQTGAAIETTTKNVKEHDVSELSKGSCAKTVPHVLTKCQNPTSSGFKEAGALLLTLPSLATTFMAGGDSGKMAEMCQISALATVLGSALNGAQNKSCQNGIAACSNDCGESSRDMQIVLAQKKAAVEANNALAFTQAKDAEEALLKKEAECHQKVQQQMQLAQQQQQANQNPMAAMQSCTQGLNGDEEMEIVDCTQSRYSHYAECSTLNKNDVAGGIGNYETGVGLTPGADDNDLPSPEDREDYWNSLKDKANASNGQGSRGGGAGAGMGGGVGGAAASNKAGAGAKRSGASLVSGGSESSSGGAGWGSGSSDSDFNKKFAGLGDKKKDLNMLTKKKLAGQGLGSAEFGTSSDDIWTRVYLRTNTRCTKQLVECAANKSQNPYGSFK